MVGWNIRRLNFPRMQKRAFFVIALLAILVFHVAGSYHVLTKSKVERICDENARIVSGVLYFQNALHQWNGDILRNSLRFFILDEAQAHPRFFEAMEVLVLKLLYSTRQIDVSWMILVVNACFLLVLLFSVYGIGSIFYNEEVGLLATLFISFFPAVFGLARIAMLDFPLMCMVSLSFYVLLKTKGFSSLLFSILFGVVFGLAELTKESAILFVIGPLIFYVIRAHLVRKDIKMLVNLFLAVLCFLVVAGSVYLRRDNLHSYATYFAKASMRLYCQSGAMEGLTELMFVFGPGIFLIFTLSAVSFILNFKKNEKFIFAWMLFPLIIFSMWSNKSFRFILPVMPAIALAMAREVVVYDLYQKHKKRCICFLLAVLLGQYLLINSGYWDGSRLSKGGNAYFSRGIVSIRQDPYFKISKELFTVFKSEELDPNTRKTILVLYDFPPLQHQMSLDMIVDGLSFNVLNPVEPDDVDILKSSLKDAERVISSADYVMEKTGYQGFFGSPVRESIKKDFDAVFSRHRDDFLKIAEEKVSDNSAVYIYRKIK